MTEETGPASADSERRAHLRVVTDDDVEPAASPDVDEPAGSPDVDELAEVVFVDESADDEQPQDWAWVAQWRESAEPTPWASGLPLAAFAAVLAGVAVWVLSAGLADRPILAVALNLLVAGGLAPAMWLCRNLPVLRWFAAGAAVGVVVGWIAALAML